ncbi:MAG: hypothetical protein RQ754_16710 [Desulfuromonadales bacterium]|nr:hypothetical protein [Desulfuromonadales bacterium]
MTLRLPFQWLLLALIVLGVFYPAIFGGFSLADDTTLVNRLVNLEHFDFSRLFFRSGGYYYRPIVSATFYLDQIFWGASAIIMHVENLLLHLLNATLVFAMARRFCTGNARLPNWLPLLMAIAFALHPITTEAVCWVSGRFDLLATTFVLLSTWLLLRGLERPGLWRLLPALLAALLGCLSKETALFFFGGAVFLIFIHHRQWLATPLAALRATLPALFLWSGGAVVYLVFRQMALAGRDTGIKAVAKAASGQAGLFDWLDQVRIAIKVGGFYLKKIFVPYPLNFAITEISGLYQYLGLVFVALCLWLLWRVWQGSMAAAMFWAAVFTGSAAFMVVFGKMAWTLLAERYLYMPAAFFVLGWCAWGADRRNDRLLRLFLLGAVLFVLVGAALTIERSRLWSDPVALTEDTVAKSPKFVQARKDLANYYFALGRSDEGKALLEGLVEKTSKGGYIEDDISLAWQLEKEEKYTEAQRVLRKALENPGKQFVKLANALIALNHKRLAAEADVAIKNEIRGENVRLFEQLRKGNNDPFLAYRLAREYCALGEVGKARALFSEAYRRAPASAHYREAAGKLAETLAEEE